MQNADINASAVFKRGLDSSDYANATTAATPLIKSSIPPDRRRRLFASDTDGSDSDSDTSTGKVGGGLAKMRFAAYPKFTATGKALAATVTTTTAAATATATTTARTTAADNHDNKYAMTTRRKNATTTATTNTRTTMVEEAAEAAAPVKVWSDLWKELKRQGWTSKNGTGLMSDYYYIKPRGKIKGGTVGQDYFTSKEDVQSYYEGIGDSPTAPAAANDTTAPAAANDTTTVPTVMQKDISDSPLVPTAPAAVNDTTTMPTVTLTTSQYSSRYDRNDGTKQFQFEIGITASTCQFGIQLYAPPVPHDQVFFGFFARD